MKTKLTFFAILLISALLFFSCDFDGLFDDNDDKQTEGSFLKLPHFSFPDDLAFPKVMHYGADLGIFPVNAREWIINTAFPKEKMELDYMLDSKLKVWWDDNNRIKFEASYTIPPGYVGSGEKRTWGTGAGYGGGMDSLSNTYGEYADYQSLRFKYEYSLYVEYLLKNDKIFSEIINFAKNLCDELEYDWTTYGGYTGKKPVIKTPGKKYVQCGGYANEVTDKVLTLNSVQTVQYWRSPSHAWNVLKLKDGRTIYMDLTWFDNEHINHDTGAIYQTDDYGWLNLTFNEHLFRFSNVSYGSRTFEHDMGELDKEKSR